ncbi:MAG: restriction endonuclease subunit S [Desulfamplus sp.]|nr:restriction endonuclease subunit S [Desulfamplus sp.]
MKLSPYPEYKDSTVHWIGRIPAHWPEKRAKQFFKEIDQRSQTGEEEMLSVSHITGVTPRSQKNVTMFKAESNVGQKICQPGDLVINTMWAWMAAMGVSNYSGIVSPSYGVYRPINNQEYDLYYLDRLLRIEGYRSEYICRSTGIRSSRLRLYPDKFLSMRIVRPPQDEQQHIAKFLKAQDRLIRKFISNKRRLIELLKEQKQNIINQAVTRGINPNVTLKPSGVEWIGDIPEHWEVIKLKHIATMKSGDNLTSEQISDSGAYPVFGGNGLRGYFNNYNKDGKYLLIGRQGALCGNVHLVEGKFWATEHAVVTDVRPGILTTWYYYMLTVMNLNQYSESAAQPGISVEKIQKLRTALPSPEEQQTIVSFISSETSTIDYTITRAQRQIALIREYRTRLISDVVTGKVDVRGIEVPEDFDDDIQILDEDTPETDAMTDDDLQPEDEA